MAKFCQIWSHWTLDRRRSKFFWGWGKKFTKLKLPKRKNPFKVDFFISFESSQRRSLLILLSRTLLQYNASNLSGQARQTSSVTRWWNKKLPKFPHKNAQKVATHFLNDIVIIRNSPKITKIFGQLLWDNLLPRICKNHLIWSHCRRGVF